MSCTNSSLRSPSTLHTTHCWTNHASYHLYYSRYISGRDYWALFTRGSYEDPNTACLTLQVWERCTMSAFLTQNKVYISDFRAKSVIINRYSHTASCVCPSPAGPQRWDSAQVWCAERQLLGKCALIFPTIPCAAHEGRIWWFSSIFIYFI